MATYRKKASKPKSSGDQTSSDLDSTTADIFNSLDVTVSKSELWIKKNSTTLLYTLLISILSVLCFLGYNEYILEPKEKEASNELSYPRKYFNEANIVTGSLTDSLLKLGLEGADNKYGFLDISSQYSGTKAGNIANYYAGVSYLKMKDYEKAIEYLSKFKSEDELLGPTAIGAIGDAFADIDQVQEAFEYYQKAAKLKDNEFTTPLFLFKAARTALDLGRFQEAEKILIQIKEKYPLTDIVKNIDQYIYIAKYAQ